MKTIVKKQFKYSSPILFQRMVWLPLRATMIIFCSLEVKGIENVKKVKDNMIFAPSHLSEMDPLLMVSVLPFFSQLFPVIYVSLASYKYLGPKWKHIFYGGFFFRMIGAYPTYKGLKNYELALPHHLKILKEKKNVGIFPHGRITRDFKDSKARGGVTFLARKTNLPIIPVKITGTENFTIQNILSGKKKITFTFGKPIYPKELFKDKAKVVVNEKRNDYETAAEIVMKRTLDL